MNKFPFFYNLPISTSLFSVINIVNYDSSANAAVLIVEAGGNDSVLREKLPGFKLVNVGSEYYICRGEDYKFPVSNIKSAVSADHLVNVPSLFGAVIAAYEKTLTIAKK